MTDISGKWKFRNTLCNWPASKNILIKTKHEAAPFTPQKLTSKPGALCWNGFLLQNPTSVYWRLKVLPWFWTPAWKTRGCFPFHSPGLPRQQRDKTQVRARTTRATKPDPAELQFGMPLLEGIPFFRSCVVPGPNTSDQGLSSWKVETKIRLWWAEWAHDRPSR